MSNLTCTVANATYYQIQVGFQATSIVDNICTTATLKAFQDCSFACNGTTLDPVTPGCFLSDANFPGNSTNNLESAHKVPLPFDPNNPTMNAPILTQPTSGSNAGMIGGIVFGVLFFGACIVGGIFAFIKQRRNQKEIAEYNQRQLEGGEVVALEQLPGYIAASPAAATASSS
ncbi:UNVERIFIED_CONTAM: hypothetical protein HDU68_007874 [Siphonaria sp. JEL0065]|nr:hypothetical protein HDU68_007874 [Siphonaria sp. JEL0065]